MKTIILPVLLLFSVCGSSQVVYTDIPDTTFQSYALDIDNDGNTDLNYGFFFMQNWPPNMQNPYTYYNYIRIPPGSSNEVLCNAHTPSPLPVWINVGAGSSDWDTGPPDFHLDHNGSGIWYGNTPNFIGVHFFIDSASHYGWVRMSHASTTITIYDYAYELQPDSTIVTAAGSPNAVIENNPANRLNIYSWDHNIFIQQLQTSEMLHVSVYNTMGQIVYDTNAGETVLQIEIAKAGIYFVEVESEGVITRQKILITE
jgi:hypothetical protein